MLHFYGAPMSSAGRTHLMLEEVGVPYEYHRVNIRDEVAHAEYKKVNPSGKIPFIVDGDVRLAESCAINFYLAEKYKPELLPQTLEGRARAYQWSFWVMTNLQPDALAIMFAAMRPNDPPADLPAKKANVQKLCDQLEGSLGTYLIDNKLSVADIIVGSVINFVQRSNGATLGPKTTAWLDGLRGRDAWKRVMAAG